MGLYLWNATGGRKKAAADALRRCVRRLGVALLAGVFVSAICAAQDIKVHVTYVCNGERIYAENCNIRDTSDTSTCMVAHPDRPQHNGFMVYTYETRGALKKLLPTCKQPSAQELAAEDAFQKKQQAIYDANVAKANPQPSPQSNQGNGQPSGGGAPVGQITPPKDAEERAMRRCVSSGRLVATCTGNSLLGAFGQMISQVLPAAGKEPTPGPEMAGVFQGADNWRLDFIDNGVLVNCAFLSPNQESYSIAFKSTGPVLTIDTTPKPLVLAIHADGTITGPGPVTIDGVVASGTSGPDPNAPSGYTNQYGMSLSNQQAASSSEVYQNGQQHYGPVTPGGGTYTTFAPRRATCPALNLTSKGAGVGVQTMETNLLKSVFSDGDTGPPTPVGIRMHGIFAAASTGFSAQFFPESVVLGCGPDAARAYSYTVAASGSGASIKVDAPDHPLTMALRPDGSIDAGSGSYQVHGRIVTGQNDDGDFTFAPMDETCNLALLTPSKEIPSTGGMAGTAATMTVATNAKGSGLSTPQAPLGNATLSIVSGIPAQPGVPNPLAGRPYVLLRDSYGDALSKGGVSVPPGVSPYKYVGQVCAAGKTPDCQTILNAINVNAASAVRADANGSGTMPGVPPGTYYLMISTRYNNQSLVWGQAVQLRAGANSLTLNPRDATPIN
jgi:hypothetical protein